MRCKLSGVVTADDLRPYIQTAIEFFGPERLMFGYDWPVCLLAGSYERVYKATREVVDSLVSPSESEAIFGGNAAKFYGLKI